MCSVKGAQINTHSCHVEVKRIHCKADKCFGQPTPVEAFCMCVDVGVLRGPESTSHRKMRFKWLGQS